MTSISEPRPDSTAMPSSTTSDGSNRPPRRAKSSAWMMKHVRTVVATTRARDAACSAVAPARRAAPASHTQHETPNDTVPVSTRCTSTPTSSAASRALLSVPEWSAPTWTDTIASAPPSTSDP